MSNDRKPAWKREKKISGPQIGHLEVVVINDDIQQALKVLKNKMSKEGVLSELKQRRAYEKPSEKKRRKHREALKKARKTQNKKYHSYRKRKPDETEQRKEKKA